MTRVPPQIEQSASTGRVCRGCGTELPPKTWKGRDRKWCSDRCRKQQYAGTCADCGTPTNGSDGREKAGERCQPCRTRYEHDNRHWTPQALIEEVQRFASIYGRPPRELDWNPRPSNIIRRTNQWKPEGKWPSSSLAPREFGSWNAMIEAAGFRPFDHAVDHQWGVGRPLYREEADSAA